jgi:hypothetical protein
VAFFASPQNDPQRVVIIEDQMTSLDEHCTLPGVAA